MPTDRRSVTGRLPARYAYNFHYDILTRQTDFGVVDAVGHQDQNADALGMGLFPGQVTRGLLVLDRAAERGDPAAGLEVERSTSPHQIVGGRTVPQAQLLTFLQHPERRGRVAYLNTNPPGNKLVHID